mmetsp:Transcript_19923/g.45395  ORF Transcript_19923/g.45395 Transcript_19923/m.45395 type:complete len:260 (+) Transcript_19923:204-983(+)
MADQRLTLHEASEVLLQGRHLPPEHVSALVLIGVRSHQLQDVEDVLSLEVLDELGQLRLQELEGFRLLGGLLVHRDPLHRKRDVLVRLSAQEEELPRHEVDVCPVSVASVGILTVLRRVQHVGAHLVVLDLVVVVPAGGAGIAHRVDQPPVVAEEVLPHWDHCDGAGRRETPDPARPPRRIPVVLHSLAEDSGCFLEGLSAGVGLRTHDAPRLRHQAVPELSHHVVDAEVVKALRRHVRRHLHSEVAVDNALAATPPAV